MYVMQTLQSRQMGKEEKGKEREKKANKARFQQPKLQLTKSMRQVLVTEGNMTSDQAIA